MRSRVVTICSFNDCLCLFGIYLLLCTMSICNLWLPCNVENPPTVGSQSGLFGISPHRPTYVHHSPNRAITFYHPNTYNQLGIGDCMHNCTASMSSRRPFTSCDWCRKSRLGCDAATKNGRGCSNCVRRGKNCSINVRTLQVKSIGSLTDAKPRLQWIFQQRNGRNTDSAPSLNDIADRQTPPKQNVESEEITVTATGSTTSTPWPSNSNLYDSSFESVASWRQRALTLHHLLWDIFTRIFEPQLGLWIGNDCNPFKRIDTVSTNILQQHSKSDL